MKKRYYFLYITTNLVNGRYYKGQHATNNLNDGYLGSGTLFKRALKKYGRKAFKRRIVLFLPDMESLAEAERMYITEYDIHNKDCYNCRAGGVNYVPLSEEKKRDMSKMQVDRYLARKENGDVTYVPQANKPRTAPFRDEEDSIRHRGALNPMYGKTGELNATSKPVYCVELKKPFGSAMLAAKELGIAFQNISKVCQGKRQTCGGYHWRFLDPEKAAERPKKEVKERPSWYQKFDPNTQGPHQQTGYTNVRSRPVVRLDTGEHYGSCGLAAAAVDGQRRSLNKAIHMHKPYKGIEWMFLEDYERMMSVQHSQEQTLCNSASPEDSD